MKLKLRTSIQSFIHFANETYNCDPAKFQNSWSEIWDEERRFEWDLPDHRIENPGMIAELPFELESEEFDSLHSSLNHSANFYRTGNLVMQLYGYHSVTLKFVNTKGNWLYCEAKTGSVNLHEQDMVWSGVGDHQWGGVYTYKTISNYIPIVIDLGNLIVRELPIRFSVDGISQSFDDLQLSLLKSLISDVPGDKIIQFLLSNSESETEKDIWKHVKIYNSPVGGRDIVFRYKDVEEHWSISELILMQGGWGLQNQARTNECDDSLMNRG